MKNPNIVLIVADCVRAQNMSIYGYKKETTPMLERIQSNCVLYKNSVSSSCWTLPSHASIFTGTYLSKHGLVRDGDVLNPGLITMAEILRKEGYITLGICRNPYVSEFSGLDKGFDVFHDYRKNSVMAMLYELFYRRRAHDRQLWENLIEKRTTLKLKEKQKKEVERFDKVGFLNNLTDSRFFKRVFWNLTGHFDKSAKNTNNLAFRLIKKIRGKPFFIFIHYSEAHTPYVLPRKFREKFFNFKMEKEPWNVNQDYLKYYSEKVKMGESDFRILRALYDGAISYLDRRIYELYSFLEKEELLDNSMLIVTSDHGDNLGEHELLFHTFCLYDTLIKTPLLIKYPADLNLFGVEDRTVQNVDLLPTLMDILGVKDGTLLNQIQGNSLVTSDITNRSHLYGIAELVKPFGPAMRPFRNKLKKYDRRLICIRTKNKKYIHSSDGKDELYDMEKDPNEINNLIGSKEATVLELRDKLRPWLKAFNDFYETYKLHIEEETKIEFKTEIKQRLKKLGYL